MKLYIDPGLGQVSKAKRAPAPAPLARPTPGSWPCLCAAAALDKKAEDPVLLEVGELTGYADYFLLASGRSTRAGHGHAEKMWPAPSKRRAAPPWASRG